MTKQKDFLFQQHQLELMLKSIPTVSQLDETRFRPMDELAKANELTESKAMMLVARHLIPAHKYGGKFWINKLDFEKRLQAVDAIELRSLRTEIEKR